MKHAKDFVDHLEKLIELKIKAEQDNRLESEIELMYEKEDFIKFLDKLYFKTRE